jgi:hypothetical protein
MSSDFDGFPNSYDENRSWWRLGETPHSARVRKTVSPLLRNTDAFGIMASSVALIAGSMCGVTF